MTRVLIVEDEPALRRDLVDYLALRGFDAQGVGSVGAFEQRIRQHYSPEIVILDIGLPDGDGLALARSIRQRFAAGIIMLTARGDTDDRILGFESGADIYLVKHSTLREIEAAIESLVRRLRGHTAPDPGQYTDWVLDSQSWDLVAPNHSTIRLTAAELAFLRRLMEQPGETCSRDALAESLTRPRAHFTNRHLDALVNRLRRKIERVVKDEAPIRAVYGLGYVFSRPARIDN
ncbi:response regulator transcription factor [Salinisphaera sp. T31B1]|uniref:response regulator transcription factor n=1 Tax=Salinisphaera sp. T31B1 TaxID=727963 RepID=UPI0033428398